MSSFVRILFLLGDIFFLNLSIALAFYVTGVTPKVHNIVYFVVFSNLTWLFLIVVASPYSFSKNWDGAKTIKNQFFFIFIHLLVVTSLIFFYDKEYTAVQVLLVYIFFTPLFYSSKFLTRFFFYQFGHKKNIKNILLISQSNSLNDSKGYLANHPDWEYNFIEVIDGESVIPLDKIKSLCEKNPVDEIFVCISHKNGLNELIDFGLSKLVPIKLMSDLRKEQGNSADEKHFNQISYINQSTVFIDAWVNQLIKRVFDIFFSSVFIITVMSWLYPLIALLIKLDSKGPVLFKQKRSGEKNRPFTCLKFRSMRVSTDADIKQATKDDARVTKLGAFLRRSSIDELPQFFNVFMGDMSIVGPRPHMIKHTEEYSRLIEKFMSRHYIKPGVTGLAQAMGYRGETKNVIDMKNRITLDRFYIENWSFVFDLKIIYLTIVSLLKGSEKAY